MRILTNIIILLLIINTTYAHASNYKELVVFGTSKWILFEENSENKHYVSIINNVYPDGSIPIFIRTVIKKAAGKKELLDVLKERTGNSVNWKNFKHMIEFDIVNCRKDTKINIEYYFLDSNFEQLYSYENMNASNEVYYINPKLRRIICR